MAKTQSLDDVIAKKAEEFADQMKQAAAMADKEEEIRIEAVKQLAFIEKEAGINLEGKHEFTVASGRVDSVYDRVIIEYKNPSSASDRIGPKADSPGTKKVVEQIKKRFYDMRSQHGQALNTLFGVGLDGNHFVFVRFRDDKWQVQEPVEVNKYSAERFLWALFNLGNKGKPFSPEYLAGDFGSDAPLAQTGIRAIYDAIVSTDNPKAQTFFSQWKILFGEVCGYDVDNPSDKIKKLAEFYEVGPKAVKPAELLFAVHTYYALFMKLLASEIVAFFHKLPTPLQKMIQASTPAKLKREMEDLEAGSIFRHLNITNFLEGDLFAWYTNVWSEPVEKFVRTMVAKLDNYNPGTLSEDPATSRDLLKKLYQQLFPKSVRHDLGEYYTPDWLAEHVLNEVGYVGDPDKRLLDPACGSGTFLVMAINRIRKWYDENRERCRFDEGDLCRKILANVIGFDLNPLAVMAARTNYLIAIRDLVGHVDRVEIPIYLCDSILTPSTYGDLFVGAIGGARQLKTAAASFLIPTEIATNRDDVARYADQLEFCIRNGYSPKEFIERCQEEGLPVSAEHLHTDLYKELVRLDKANKNRVWARIIKNSFAPLFVGRVDYVCGNPPWIRWGYLPEDYRNETKPLWHKYGLFSLTGAEAQLGSGEKDICQLFTYACIDSYLDPGGRLGFVITQTVFKAKGQAQGFRRFRLGRAEPLKVISVDDMVALRPFEAANLTTTFTMVKGARTEYPVPYKLWSAPSGGPVDHSESYESVVSRCPIAAQLARPLPGDDANQWLTAGQSDMDLIMRLLGKTPYQAERGAGTDPYAVFQVRPLKRVSGGRVLIENHYDAPRAKVRVPRVQACVEYTLLYPLCRGEDIDRWLARTGIWLLMTQNPETRLGYERGTMIASYRGALDYLKSFEGVLRARRSNFVRRLMDRSGFWAMYGISENTVSKHKLMWCRMGATLRAAVAQEDCVPGLELKCQVPSDTVTYVACTSQDEAHYLCATMNSALVRRTVMAYSSAGRGFGAPAILDHLAIPRFDESNPTHRALAQVSKKAHALARRGDQVADEEADVDSLSARLFGLSAAAVASARRTLGALKDAEVESDSSQEGVED